MSRSARFILALCCLAMAIGVNLLVCRWGSDRSDTAIMTFESGPDGAIGAFAAPWLDGRPVAATLLGILLPMFLVGLAAYVLARKSVPKTADG